MIFISPNGFLMQQGEDSKGRSLWVRRVFFSLSIFCNSNNSERGRPNVHLGEREKFGVDKCNWVFCMLGS
jgi:hypothetical protein